MNSDRTWWQVVTTKGPDGKGWVFGELVTPNEAAKALPPVEAPPTPTAAATAIPKTPLYDRLEAEGRLDPEHP